MSRGRLGLAVVTAVALAVPALAGSPADAEPVRAEASSVSLGDDVVCVVPPAGSADAATSAASGLAGARVRPGDADTPDTSRVTAADLAALSGGTAEPRALARMRLAQARRALPSVVTIPVHVTLVSGKHRGDRPARRAAVARYVKILNDGYAGKQSSASASSRFRFKLKSVRQVKNDRWYHAVMNTAADRQMRRKLHRGGPGVLNLYVTRPGRDLLGFARFPWQYAKEPRLDGVTVSVDALPGGRATNFNLGDTLVHEVGHWLGLLHTFQPDPGARDGCGDWRRPTQSGDRVADTPPQAVPSKGCNLRQNTCTAGEKETRITTFDAVQNFMDYSYDACMNQFTPGQVARMDRAFEAYRLRR